MKQPRWMMAAGWIGACLTLSAPAAGPALQIAVEGPALRLSWDAPADGAAVTVETTTNLAAPDWKAAPANDGWPTTALTWTTPLPASGSAFFRLVATAPPARGTLLTNVLIRTFTSAEMAALFKEYQLPAANPLAVEARRLVYATVNVAGAPTRASMLAVLPVGVPKAVPFAVYEHGTTTVRDDVPSRLSGEGDVGLLLGASGYLAVLPDYLGLGDSPGFHPYHHAKSYGTVSVDALRAMRSAVGGWTPGWNGQLFLTGYSEGGFAALATQRELETLHTNEFTLTASSPAAGAYDLSGATFDDFLSSRLPPNPYYYPYLFVAYQETYHLAASYSEVFRAPYDTTLPPLFDGQHDASALNAVLPAHPSDILRPEVLTALRTNPNHPWRVALRENDAYRGWYPKVPTRLYHCQGDQDVLIANSQVAFNAFKAAGSKTVELVDPLSFADHRTCAPFALYATKLWFDSLRK